MAVTILYVEDNKMNFLLVKKILSIYEARVLHAEDGEQALTVATESTPDLVLMDLQLPGLDGFQVADSLRTQLDLTRVPIIAISASVLPQDREDADRAGFDGYIEKPVDVQFLRMEVERVLGDRLARK